MAAKALLKAAIEAFEAGDCRGVLGLVPSDDDRPYPLLVCRGMAALHLKEWKVCEGAFRRCTELQPDLPKAWKGLADLYEATNEPVKALDAYRALHRIAESKGNAGKAVEWLVAVAACQDRAKQSSEARDTLRKALLEQQPQVAAAGVRVSGLVRLVDLEERRLRLQPERRGELLQLYVSLLEAVEQAAAEEGQGGEEDDDGGAGGRERDDGSEARRCLARLPPLAMEAVAGAKAADKVKAWGQAVELGRRVMGVCSGALAGLEAVVWGWAYAGEGSEAEALRAAKTLVQEAPQAAAGNALVGWKLLGNGHVQQAREYLDRALKGGRVAVASPEGPSGLGSSPSDGGRLLLACPSCLALSCLLELHALATRFAATDRAAFSALLTRFEDAVRQDEALWGLPGQRDVRGLGRLARARFLEWCRRWGEALSEYEALGGEEGGVGRARVLTASGAEPGEVVAVLQEGAWAGAEAKALEGWARWRRGRGGQGDNEEEGQAALQLLEQAASQDAKQGYYLGRAYVALGDGDKALATLLRTAQADPTHAPTFTALGHWYRGSGGGAEAEAKAVRCYRRALELEALEEEAGQALSQVLLQQQGGEGGGGVAEARRVWSAASSANAAAGWAWRWTGWEHLGRKQALEAVTCFQYAVRADEADAAAWVGLARAYHGLEMEAAALRAMEKAVGLGGAEPGELGLLQLASGLVEEAVVSLQQAGGQQRRDVLVLKGLAGAALMQACSRLAEGFTGRALAALEAGLRAVGEVVAEGGGPGGCVWKLLGDLHTMKGVMGLSEQEEEEEGVRAYEQAAQAAEGQALSEALSWVDVGVALYVRSRALRDQEGHQHPQAAPLLRRARQALEKALRLDPLCCPAWSVLGLVDERPLVRQHCLVRAIQLEGDGSAWANLGVLYASRGRKELAREAYRGLQLVQDHPLMWVGLALLHEEEQDWPTARDAYRAALEVGAHPSAQLGLSVCNVCDEGGAGADLGEALAQALILVAQRPRHALGLNLAGLLLLDLAGQAGAAEQLLVRSLAEPAQLDEGAHAVVQHNLARARAALGTDPEPPGLLQGFLLAKSLSVRGDWAGVVAVSTQQLAASPPPTLQSRWRALAALAEWQQGRTEAALQGLAPLLPLQPDHWPQQLYVGLHALLCALGQPQQAAALSSPSAALALTLCGPQPLAALSAAGLDGEPFASPHAAAALASEALLQLAAGQEGGEDRVEAHGQALEAYRSALGRLRPCSPGATAHEAADWLAPAAAAWGAETLGLEEASEGEGGQQAWSGGKRQLLKALHLYPQLSQGWRALGHGLVCWEGRAELGAAMVLASQEQQQPPPGGGGQEEGDRRLVGVLGGGVAAAGGGAPAELSLLDQARAEAAAGRGAGARELYKAALRQAPGLVEGWLELALLYEGEGRTKAAHRCLEVAVEAAAPLPADTRCAVWTRLAEHHYRRGDRSSAMTAVGEACKARPKAAVPLLLRGLIWQLEGPSREKQAQDNFKKAQELRPHDRWIRQLAAASTPGTTDY